MTVFDKFGGSNCIVPKLCAAFVALFMMAQLVIIATLGASFKAPRSSDFAEPESKTMKGKSTKMKSPPRRLSAKNNLAQSPSNLHTKMSENESSKTHRQSFPLLNNPTSWPPCENRLYPDMELYNQDGKLTRLSDLSGNVIIVQPVAMGCPLSQAYSGANKNGKGAFKLCFPNKDAKDFGQRMFEFTDISMKTSGLVFVQILFYNMNNEPPSIEDARQWAKHFDLRTSQKQFVLVAIPEMVTKKSKMLIPGFQLIDRSFILLSDSTGVVPKRSLYLHFFPALQSVLPQALVDQPARRSDSI